MTINEHEARRLLFEICGTMTNETAIAVYEKGLQRLDDKCLRTVLEKWAEAVDIREKHRGAQDEKSKGLFNVFNYQAHNYERILLELLGVE